MKGRGCQLDSERSNFFLDAQLGRPGSWVHLRGPVIQANGRLTFEDDLRSGDLLCFTKGQIISECPYEIIVWTKIPTKKFPRFLS